MKKIFETLKNKWAEYLLEIIVIMIGILGAFALNNWNANIKERLYHKDQLVKLRIETISTQGILAVQIEDFVRAELYTKHFMLQMAPSASMDIAQDSINSLFLGSLNIGFISQRALALGSFLDFEIVENKNNSKLIELLSQWRVRVESISRDYEHLENNRDVELQRVLMNAGIPGIMFMVDQRDNLANSRFSTNYQLLLRSKEIYSVLSLRRFKIGMLKRQLESGVIRLDVILNLIDESLDEY